MHEPLGGAESDPARSRVGVAEEAGPRLVDLYLSRTHVHVPCARGGAAYDHFHALPQFALRSDERVVVHARLQGSGDILRGTRFEQEAEEIPLVYGLAGGLDVGVAREHDPRGVGGEFLDPRHERDAVHARHLEVGHDDGEALAGFQFLDHVARVRRRGDGKLRMQVGSYGVEDGLVVIDKKRCTRHCCMPSGMAR